MKTQETAISFFSGGSKLYGVIHNPMPGFHRGILVLGGRLGGHRRCVLLARFWAEHGVPILRFDYRGTGESEGESETIKENHTDIKNAIDAFTSNIPGLKEIVIWGLCGEATTALLYAPTDPRVTGVVMVNPWIDAEHARPSNYMHYYTGRITNINFWSKIVKGEFDFRGAAITFIKRFKNSFKIIRTNNNNEYRLLCDSMAKGLESFKEALLLILSGEDINAHLFTDTFRHSINRAAAKSIAVCHLLDADHVFSRREWRDQVASKTVEWILAFKR
jgi:exosortase A-associated hydrolase 1